MPETNDTPNERFLKPAFAMSAVAQTMSSREIADLCEARHNDVATTIARLFEKGVLRESRKTTRTFQPEGGGRPSEVYDLTKRDTLVVVSGYNDELRARIIDRWQELEASAPSPAAMNVAAALSDPASLRTLLLQNVEERLRLAQQVADAAPKLEAFERIAGVEGSLCITDAAKSLQVRPKSLFDFLRSHGWIYSPHGARGDIAYSAKLQQGLMEHKTTTVHRSDGSEKIITQARITAKGLARLASEFPPPATMAA